nr:neutral ceramidase [Quercus suber]
MFDHSVRRPCARSYFVMDCFGTLPRNGRGVDLDSKYLIGLGSYDITGPAIEVNMMGYANIEQIASGVHFRLQARTFIIAEPQRK